jgi:hypothetical protein
MNTIHFAHPTSSADGRTLSSVVTVRELPDGTRIELEISTAHWKGRGYRASATRQHIDGVCRSIALTFGADSDNQSLPQPGDAPGPGARFNRTVLARLHSQTLRLVLDAADEWIEWAQDCTAARR